MTINHNKQQQQQPQRKNSSDINKTTTRVVIMKTFRLVPLILAGFCGYLHTVINRRFDEMGDLMSSSHGIDAPPNAMAFVNGALGGGSGGGVVGGGNHNNLNNQQLQQQQQRQQVQPLMPAQRVNMGTLQGPAVDLMEKSQSFEWKPPKSDVRIMANSNEYDQMLLDYTMNLLPNHRDPSASKGNIINMEGGEKKSDNNNNAADVDSNEEDVNNPKPYKFKQIDMIVPASGQDDRLRVFAERLGVALKNYKQWYETERKPALLRKIKQEEEEDQGDSDMTGGAKSNNNGNNAYDFDLKFRLLVTRYPEDAQKKPQDFDALIMDLAERTTLPREQINLVIVGDPQQGQKQEEEGDGESASQYHPIRFNRAHARNVLHQNACHSDNCIVTAFDVDIQVLPCFFHRALLSVTPHVKAYFPIVFSEFNPETVQIVQDFLLRPSTSSSSNNNGNDNNNNNIGVLPEEDNEEQDPMLGPYSRHRGLWRDFGYGMYVMAGSDAKRFRFNEEHQGWGHEDNDFYKLVHNNMRVDRQREHGLIHAWHTKNCSPGKDIVTNNQWLDCLSSRDIMEGSTLGLLLRPAKRTYKLEDFPGLPAKKKPTTKTTTAVEKAVKEDKDKELKEEAKAKAKDNDDNDNGDDDKTEEEETNKGKETEDREEGKGGDSGEKSEPKEEEEGNDEETNEATETEQEKGGDSGEKQEVGTQFLRRNLVEERRQQRDAKKNHQKEKKKNKAAA